MNATRWRPSAPLALMLALALGAALLMAPAATSTARGAAAAVTVVDPTVEYRTDPLGLDVPVPRFSWRLESAERAQAQSAYRILVASSPAELAAGRGDVWDSGRVESDRAHLVEYGGPALAPTTRYHWAVQVWDAGGDGPATSPAGWWETGLMDDELGAAWIGHPIQERLPRGNTQENHAARLEPGATLGQTFTTDQPFTAAESRAPTWHTTGSGVTLTLYRGGPDGEQLARQVVEDVADNAWIGVSVDEPLEPGAYYLEQSAADGTVGWWSHSDNVYAHGEAYADGEPVAGDRSIRWQPAVAEADGRTPQLRTEFELDGEVASARVYASALGVYELELNGQPVGDHRLAPGWTDYDARVQYQTFDVTDQVRQGGNAIGATVGPGWYAGHIAIFGPDQYGTRPWFAARLEVTYADGGTEVVATDDTWRSATGPVLESDLLMGETYDAREATPGWTEPGFDDGDWQPAVVNEDATAPVVAQADPPVRVTQELTPVEITEPEDGVYVVDLGQNMVGTVRLRVEGEAGQTVRLRHAEVLNPDGTLYTDNLRSALATDHYTLAGDGEEVYEPRFTFHGFRYVELTGLTSAPDTDTVTGLVMHTDAPMTSQFETSDTMLNQLFSNITWGQRGNFLSIPTDTPARDERMGWTGDINVFVGAAAYNMEVAPFLAKWLQDLRDAQFDDGAFPDVAPIVGFLGGGSAGWGDAGVTVPWTLWQRYGDLRVLEEHYPAMQAWIDYLVEHSDGYLRPAEGYGDWLNVDDETPKDVIGTAYFAHSTALVAQLAQVLGEDADAARYVELAADVRAAFVAAYVDENGRVEGDTQTAYVLALGFDLVPDELRAAAADRLVELIEGRDWHLSTGFLGTPDLLPVLTETGHTDVAYRLITQDSYPSWGYQIANGATTMWEHWDSIKPDGTFEDPGMNSFNHYAYGAVGEWMFDTIAGIEPAAPGFGATTIRPRPGGGLEHAAATYHSVAGDVHSGWRQGGRTFELDVSIPVNTVAEVWVPAVAAGAVTEGGRPADSADGVAFDRMADGYAVFRVGSGDYRFVADDVLGQLDLAAAAAAGLAAAIDEHTAALTAQQAAHLRDRQGAVAGGIAAAVEGYGTAGDAATLRQLHRVLTETGRLLTWIGRQQAGGALPGDVAGALTAAVHGVHEPLSAASAVLTGVAAELTTAAGSVVAGGAVEVTATVRNTGTDRLQGVELAVAVPDGWTATALDPDRAASLPPGGSLSTRFSVAVPLTQPVAGGVPLTGTAAYLHAGGRAELPLAAAVDVTAPVTLGGVAADPRILDEPGTTVTVTAQLTNHADEPVDGVVRAAVPAGWSIQPAELDYRLDPGESRSVSFQVVPPAEPAAADVVLTADYGEHDGDTASVRITYELAAWLFDTDGDLEGWQPNNQLTGSVVSGGALRTTSTGGDPYLVGPGGLDIDAADGVYVELTMQVSADSGAQLFWTSAAEPSFSEGRSTKFAVIAGEPRTYQVPVRAFAGTLTGLRLDPLERTGDIVIDEIRVVR